MEPDSRAPAQPPDATPDRVTVSVVIPMYNEQQVAALAVSRVAEELAGLVASYEVICVDDGSADETADVLEDLARQDARVVPVHFSRNFGKEAALTAGIDVARGEAVILIDADLQHPPSLIPRMIERWRGGAEVVEAHKRRRSRENPLYRLLAWGFYRLMGLSTGDDLRGSSDYKLLDRQVVDVLRALPERGRFFRGLVAWVGFEHARLEFDVQERAAGASAWGRGQLIRYAISNVFAFSTVPLFATAWAGLFATVFAVLLAIDTLYNYVRGYAVSGFTTVIMAMAFFAGLTLMGIGVVAVYMAKVLDEVKGRPVYIVRKPEGPHPSDGSRGEAPSS